MTGLPVSRLINVSINLTPQLATFPNLSTCLILGTSTVIDVIQRMRSYSTIAEVAADFGTSAEEYLAALLWFEQNPSPTSLRIGRWAKTASSGQLIGGTLSTANQVLSAWTAITTGSVKFTINGGSEQSLTGLNFSAAGSLAAVAAIIDAALTSATVAYDSVNKRFVVTSSTTGGSSVVSFATAGASGVDISNMLMMRSTSSGAYQANGIAAQSALDTVTLFDNQFSSQWYGLVIPSAVNADHQAVAAYIEATTSPPHFYGVTTQEAGALNASDTTNIAYLLQQSEYQRSTVQYSSSNAYAVVSLLARILTTNWESNNTVITLMYKQEPGITAEQLTTTQADALQSFNANVFAAYNNDTAIIQYGKSASGVFVDSVIGCDWLQGQIQTNIYNLLYGSSTKIPQTDDGNHQLANAITAACQQGVNNGLLAPGVWNAEGAGQVVQGDFLPKGFYVYQPPVSAQAPADRAAREAVAFTVLAKLAGAIHTADVRVNVNT